MTKEQRDWLDELERRCPDLSELIDKVRESAMIDTRFREILLAEGLNYSD